MSQDSKLHQFETFIFEGDDRWHRYFDSVELVGASNRDTHIRKLKARWYKRNIDPDFDSTLVGPSTSQEEGRPAVKCGAAGSRMETPQSGQAASKGARSPQSGRAGTSGGTSGAAETRKHGALYHWNAVVNLAVCLLGALFVASLVVAPRRKAQVFKLCMQAAIMAHLTRLADTQAGPPLRPFRWQALTGWISLVSQSSDAHYALACMLFTRQGPNVAVVICPVLFAVLRLAAYCRRYLGARWSLVGTTCNAILAKQTQAFYLMAVVDIALFGNMLLAAIFNRALLLPFAYLQMLRHRYKSPTAGSYHRDVWRRIHVQLAPVLQRSPQMVQRGIHSIQTWFTS